MSRVVPGNGRPITIWWYRDADGYGRGLARALAIVIATFSPASRGPAPTPVGVPGYGVNRATGYTSPQQLFGGATQPLRTPEDLRVGIGAGVSGQPGLPSTGSGGGAAGSLAAMSARQYGPGFGR